MDSEGGEGPSTSTEDNGSAASEQSLSTYCAQRACPGAPGDVPTFCKECPGGNEAPSAGCTANIFGGTRRYNSSCGGISVDVHAGFDHTVWHFNAEGALIGVSFSSDVGGEKHGQQCEQTGMATDLCATGGGGGAPP